MYIDNGRPVLQDILDCFLQQPLEQQWNKTPVVTQDALLPVDVVLFIVNQAKEIFRGESNVVTVEAPVNVVGDIHGQFIDLLYLFELCGPLSQPIGVDTEDIWDDEADDNVDEVDGSKDKVGGGQAKISEKSSCDTADEDEIDTHDRGDVQIMADGTPMRQPLASSKSLRQCSPKKPPVVRARSYPTILRKRSQERTGYTFSRRRSVWVNRQKVEEFLSSVKEDKDGKKVQPSIPAGVRAAVAGSALPVPRQSIRKTSFSRVDDEDEEPVYLFMGDYVDRGNFGCECILYLFALKIVFPQCVFMLRGNHETRCMTKRHFDDGSNFEAECTAKYGAEVYEAIMQCFDCLPLSASVVTGSKSFLAMHGGLSSKIKSVKDIMAIDRFCEPPLKGPMCDLLWADPINEKMAEPWGDSDYQEFLEFDFLPNPVRGCSCFYCFGAIQDFLTKNGIAGILRAHECKEEGISYHFAKTRAETFEFPLVTTIFSAPNYCGTYSNKGAVVRITDTDIEIMRFGSSSANPLQVKETPDELADVSVDTFGADLSISEVNSEAFTKAAQQDQSSEAHPGWQSLRKVTRIVSLLSKYRRAASLSGIALLKQTSSSDQSDMGSQLRRTYTNVLRPDSASPSLSSYSTPQAAKSSALRARTRADLGCDNADDSVGSLSSSVSVDLVKALFSPKSPPADASPGDGDDRDAGAASDSPTLMTPSLEDAVRRKSSVVDSVTPEDNSQLRVLFDAIDRDGNGEISPAELEDFGLSLGCESHVIGHVQELMDQDGDGMISFQEFVEYAGELLMASLSSAKETEPLSI